MELGMTHVFRVALLRANAVFLIVAATGGVASDLLGSFMGIGPQATILGQVPNAAIGFVEAHGLALIFGYLLWQAGTTRLWHGTSCAVHFLLGTSNLVFWPMFEAAGMLAVGYVTTAFHALFAVAQGAAWLLSADNEDRSLRPT